MRIILLLLFLCFSSIVNAQTCTDGTVPIRTTGVGWTCSSVTNATGQITGPDTPPTTTHAENDEFTSSTLNAKWTVSTNSVNAVNIDTQVRGYVWAEFLGNQQYSIWESYAPSSSDFTVTAKFTGGPLGVNFRTMEFKVCGSSEQDCIIVYFGSESSDVRVGTHKVVAGVQTNLISTQIVNTGVPFVPATMYLHMQRTSGVYKTWYSFEGIDWRPLYSAGFNSGTTVARIYVDISSFGAVGNWHGGLDWIRRDWITVQ